MSARPSDTEAHNAETYLECVVIQVVFMFLERFIRYIKFEKRYSPHTVSAYQSDLDQFYQLP